MENKQQNKCISCAKPGESTEGLNIPARSRGSKYVGIGGDKKQEVPKVKRVNVKNILE